MRDAANRDESNRKVFLHGLPYETGQDALQRLVNEYGETESVALIADRSTGRSKGFAFVVFRDLEAANAIIAAAKAERLVVDVSRVLEGGD